MAIRFAELKKYFSRIVRLSICFHDGRYDNYILPSDIQDNEYDDLYIYGIGMADVEFPVDVYASNYEQMERVSSRNSFLGCGLEIVVQDEPRDIERKNNEELTFGDIRGYLQCGRNFSIIMKESWEEETYEWRDDIPKKYNEMYVYGIGIEDNLEALRAERNVRFTDTLLMKCISIVLSEKPRKF